MKENGLGALFIRHLVMAVPWGVIFLIVMFVAAIGIKQQDKEGIQYAVATGINESARAVLEYEVQVPVKKYVKEGIEFVARTAGNEIKTLLQDPEVKEDLKEVLGSGAKNPR